MEAPKMGKDFKIIFDLGCNKPDDVNPIDWTCQHRYEWSCDVCPVTIENKKKEDKIQELYFSPRICIICKISYPTEKVKESFHKKGSDRFGLPVYDTQCRFCRQKYGKKYGKHYRTNEHKNKQKDLSQCQRHTIQGFTTYMKLRPEYFRWVFEKEPTDENIQEAFEGIGSSKLSFDKKSDTGFETNIND